MSIHRYRLYLNTRIAWSPDLPLKAVITVQKYLLKIHTSNGMMPQTVD